MADLVTELAQHSLTLRRTLVAIGWGALVGVVLTAVVLAVAAGAGASAVGASLFWFFVAFVASLVLAPPLVAAGLAVLRRTGPGRGPRVATGAAAGFVLGLVEQLLFTGMSPWEFVRTEPVLAVLLLAVPAAAGAVAGVLVGPRPVAHPPEPGRDERAEDGLLDGASPRPDRMDG